MVYLQQLIGLDGDLICLLLRAAVHSPASQALLSALQAVSNDELVGDEQNPIGPEHNVDTAS